MNPEQIERTIEFLLNNQAAHDTSLAELETTVKDLANSVGQLAETTNSILIEFRAGFDTLVTLSEQTMASVKQIAEAEVRTIKRVDSVEQRLDRLENSSQ